MAVHASHAALPFVVKGARFSIGVPFLDADGDPTDPTTPDIEISKDYAAAADCTEEVTAISGMAGQNSMTFTGDETNCSIAQFNGKVASGPKATLGVLYPRVLPVFRSGTAQAGANGSVTLDAGASAIDDYYVGMIVKTTGGTGGGGGSGSRDNQARVIIDYVGSTKVATIGPNWETNPDNTTTFEVLLTEFALFRFSDLQAWRGSQPDALSSGKLPADVKLWLTAAPASLSTNGFLQVMVLRWLTDNAGGTPDALSSGKLPGDVKLWLASAPAALVGDKLPAIVLRWLTNDAGGTPNALIANRVDANAQVVGDKTNFSLSSAGIAAIWDVATAALSAGAGTVWKFFVDQLNATVGSRMATFAYTAPDNTSIAAALVAAASADSRATNLQTRLPATLTAGSHLKSSIESIQDDANAALRLLRGAKGLLIGTFAAGCTPTALNSDLAVTTANATKGRQIVVITGAAAGASAWVDTHSVGGAIAVDVTLAPAALIVAPANGDLFVIV